MTADSKERKDAPKSGNGEHHIDARADMRERLIRGLEAEWLVKEREAARAVRDAAKPKGLLGRFGLGTSTG